MARRAALGSKQVLGVALEGESDRSREVAGKVALDFEGESGRNSGEGETLSLRGVSWLTVRSSCTCLLAAAGVAKLDRASMPRKKSLSISLSRSSPSSLSAGI